ncbi:MAG: hypothetical protein ACRBCK_00625 [Alphaproteobacteria bacterium]
MTKFSRVALFALLGAVFTLPSIVPVYAVDEVSDDAEAEEILTLDEAKNLIMSQPTAAHAVSGVASIKPAVEPYDLYIRRLAYREHAKDLRATLDQRRVNYDVPRTALLNNFRDTQEKVFKAEIAAYQEEISGNADEDSDTMLEEDTSSTSSDDENMADEKTASVDDGKGLTEKPIPAEPGMEDGPKKKVVTTEDAPDFDPSNL